MTKLSYDIAVLACGFLIGMPAVEAAGRSQSPPATSGTASMEIPADIEFGDDPAPIAPRSADPTQSEATAAATDAEGLAQEIPADFDPAEATTEPNSSAAVDIDGLAPQEQSQQEEPHQENQIIDLALDDDERGSSESKRFTLKHEVSLKASGAAEIVNHRSAFRVEYSKFFLGSFFMQLDAKLNSFWSADHRAESEDKNALLETNTQEAFLQYSAEGGRTSIRAGVLRMIWGESEGGAITDEVSPRNFSELFFIPLEESRLGQGMINVDHFSAIGDWSFFYVPKPRFNKYSERGTEYFIDPLAGVAFVRDDPSGSSDDEFGMRWRKTFGQSDISVMAARLIDNDYVLRYDGTTAWGAPLVTRTRQRLTLAGMTFSHARGGYLFKGEVALKSPRGFNDAAFGVIEKDVLDTALGVTYSLGQSNTIGVEWVNSRVLGWDDRIVGVPQNSASLVINANLFFFNDTLSMNWLTFYSRPYTSYQSSLRTAYKWSDNLSIGMDLHFVDVPDRRNGLHIYRNQDQVVFRVQYQF